MSRATPSEVAPLLPLAITSCKISHVHMIPKHYQFLFIISSIKGPIPMGSRPIFLSSENVHVLLIYEVPPLPKAGCCLSWTGLVILGLLMPATLPALLLVPPSCASRSKNSDQSSASDSLLPPALSGMKSEDNVGVLGVRRKGDSGTRKAEFEAPGRARPACSRCSVIQR